MEFLFSVKCVHGQDYCLSYFSIVLRKHHDYGNLEKIKFIGITILEDEFIYDHLYMEHGNMQTVMVLEAWLRRCILRHQP